MTPPDLIATTVLTTFSTLHKKHQPRPTEWVPLSGIVLDNGAGALECVALGTGMKVLPTSKIPLAKGFVLHDCHAEVERSLIAIRAFNRFLLEECVKLLNDAGCESAYLQRTPDAPQPFTIRPAVRIHFYSSEAPCGDGSMELTMASQPDSTPWTSPALTPSSSTTHLRGRGYFSELGLVRTKPGRADSPQVSSKSCSDKLAARQALSLLLTPTALLVAPGNAYIHTIVLPASQYSAAACVRAFGEAGRLAGLRGRAWSDGGYAFRPFLVETTEVEFAFSRRAGGKLSSNLAVAMVRGWGCEALIGGVLQGRKQFAGPAAGSGVCKARLWERTAEMAPAARVQRYGELKEMAWERGVVKEEVRRVLGGWFRCGGDDFELPAGDGL